MQTDARRRLKQLFADALARPSEDRARFLVAVCDDQAMRVEVESLLASHDRAGDFLEQPSLSSAAPIALQMAAPRPQLESGRRLGPYEIQAPLGAGGMGEVYRALDTRLDRIVALKVLPRLAAQNVEARRRFEQEARAISKLNHPNICALYDIGRHDDIDFLVMEYLEGETLSKRLERGPLTPDQVVQSAIEIADALDRAHRHGVVHRDLKPSNIVLTESGAKLLDFGIAKLHAGHGMPDEVTPGVERPHITQSGRIAGTVAYMSPEQLSGGPIDARSDLFSFGAVLFEMASGHRAFSRAPVDGVTAAIHHERSPRVTDLNPDAPDALADVIGKALEPDLDRRYQRASDIRADLRRAAREWESRQGRSGAAGRRWTGRRVAAAAIVTAALAVAAVLMVWARPGAPPVAKTTQSVAVLPFKPLVAGDTDDTYLGLGIADALITQLGAFKTVTVRPLSATSRFTADRDPMTAGRELRADLVLDGAIQRAGDRLRVTVSLVRVADNVTVWSNRFDSPWTDVFQVQDAIAEQVGRALAIALPGEGRSRIARRRTSSIEAYEAYLKGRYFWNMRTAEGFHKALDYFQQAIDRDRNYAPAYAGLADTYALLGSMPYAVMPPSEAGTKAKTAATRALQIDPTLAEAHVSLAFVTYSFDWDWRGGEQEFKRAIELDPDYATAHYWYALYLGQLGRVDEQLVEAQRALDVEPLSLIGTYSLGLGYYFGRHFDLAREFARKTLEITPTFPPALRLLGSVNLADNRDQEGIAEMRQLHDLAPANSLHTALFAYAEARAGRRHEAEEVLAALIRRSKTEYVPAANIAFGYVGLGDRDSAFQWFEKGYAERSQVMMFLKIEPLFDPIRSDPRYRDLVRRVGLTP
jgi:TolB-like protein/Tfp pilus assembly protein PilF/predicted Ser/Thr protein kinase